MLNTQRGGRRRALASLLTGALVAGLAVVGVAPAGAASDTVTVSGGSATWNLKDSWTGYVGGAGTITPALIDGQSVYSPASGSVDPVTGVGSLQFGGATTYAAHGGALDVKVTDLRLAITTPTSGAVTADFHTPGGVYNDVPVADVAVATSRSGDRLTVTANGAFKGDIGTVDSNFAAYAGQAMSTLTATIDAPLPAKPATTTTTTLTVTPGGSSPVGHSVKLDAVVSPAAAGQIEFYDGTTRLGAASTTNGQMSLLTASLRVGSHAFSARFVPADATAFAPSTSVEVPHTVTTEPVVPTPVADPKVAVTPVTAVDPAVENTFTISGTGFVGAGAANGVYVLFGEKSVWSGGSPLPGAGWLKQAFVPAAMVRGGAFATTITVPAGTLDPSKTYQVATSAAHALSVTDRTLDTFTPITVKATQPVFVPKVEVFAADGATPLGSTLVRAGDKVVVKGSGFDPAGNLAPAGNRPPILAGNPAGTYVVFGKFADAWKPSAGAPSSARVVGDQRWALSQAAFDAISPAYQGAVRGQWVTVAQDGTFTAELTVKPGQKSGVDVAWPADGNFGIYTYGAGGVTNAAQELSVPINYTDAPASASLTLTPDATTVVPGSKVVLTVDGLAAADSITAVAIDGTPATFTASGSSVTLTVPRAAATGTSTVEVTSVSGARGQVGLTIVKPTVTVTPNGAVDPAVESTLTITGSGFVGAGARFGAYVLLGDASIWQGDGPLIASGWLGLQWVQPAQIVDGKFTTTIKVPAGSFDRGVDYVVATSAAHGLSATDRTLDTFTPVTLVPSTPVAAATTTTLTAESAEVSLGRAAELTASVTPVGAAGVVEFLRDGAIVATIPVAQGKAAIGVPTSVLGALEFTARFVPTDSTAFEPSASQPVTVVAVEAPPIDPTLQRGSLQWGVKESFRSYITGSIAKGGVVASGGASIKGESFDFQQVGGSWQPGSLLGSAEYGGTVTFSGHDGLLNLTLTRPTVEITSAGRGVLVVDVRSANLDGTTFDAQRVPFADLALGNGDILQGDGSIAYVNVATTLTAAGSQAFSGFYPAGTALDPVFFVLGASGAKGGGDGGSIGNPGDGSAAAPDPAKATLSTYQVAPGGQVTISGVGFGAHEAGLKSVIRSTPRTLATGIAANAGGAASATVTIPKDLEPGEHTLSLEGANHKVSAAITVTGPTSSSKGSTAQCFAQGVNGATLTWGVSDTFRAYIAGPIAKGSTTTSGVKDSGSAFTWSGGKGSFNTDLGKGRAGFGGSVKFTGHDGILDLQVSNPRVQVNGSTGTLIVDVVSSDMEGNKSTSKGVAFASLSLAGKKSTSGDTITWTGAPATLTAAGAKAFAGFYDAGTALAPVTFSFPIGGDVECDTYSGLADTGTEAGALAALAVLFVLGGAGILVAGNRRRARSLV
ncbi:HtaA domain-containing protein [Oerskovia turbata]